MLQNFYMWHHDLSEVNSSLPTSQKKYVLNH